MNKYKIILAKRAEKFIDEQDAKQRERLYKAISKLPNGTDIKPLLPKGDSYRLRIGNYRIVFRRDDNTFIVNVVDADNRGQVYNRL